MNGEKNAEVIIIDGDGETMTQAQTSTPTKPRPEDAFNVLETVNLFKIDPSPPSYFVSRADGACRREKEYCILYFLMDEPLGERERLTRKEVFGAKMM